MKDSENPIMWKSNNKGVANSAATATWTVEIPKEAKYTMQYKVSSEPSYDKLTVKMDGNIIANAVSGAGALTDFTATLSPGKHTLTAEYKKDGSQDKNDDSGYVYLPDISFAV